MGDGVIAADDGVAELEGTGGTRRGSVGAGGAVDGGFVSLLPFAGRGDAGGLGTNGRGEKEGGSATVATGIDCVRIGPGPGPLTVGGGSRE